MPHGHQCAQADPLGLAGEAYQRDPGIGGAGEPVGGAHVQVVVGPEKRSITEVFSGLRHAEKCLVGGALLRFCEYSKIHSAIMHRSLLVTF